MRSLLNVLSALSDHHRLRILALLDGRDVCVTDIYAVIGISQLSASKHLGVLRRAGLVEARRQGLWIHYRVAAPADAGVAAVLDAIIGALRDADSTLADRKKLDRRSASVVKPQAWHGTDPEFLD